MQYNHSKLSNGLNIITCNMPNFQSIAINIIVGVGSRYEPIEINGISHFLEHMAFKGTAKRNAKQIAEEFDNIGGHFNAYTAKEHTVYHARVLSEYTEKTIEILADILQNSLFNSEDIAKECGVITQEIAQTYDNPDDIAYEKLFEAAYPNQEIGRSILGTVENISSFTKEDFIKYIQKYYFAENITIAVAGNVDHSNVADIISKYFGSLPSGTLERFNSAKYIGGYSCIDKDLEQLSYIMAYESVSYMDIKEYYTAQLMSIIFGGGISSRLFQEVREKRGLVYSIGSFLSSYFETGLLVIHAGASREKLSELVKVINDEITKISCNIYSEELRRAKAQIRSSLVMANEKPGYKAEEIGKNFMILGRYLPQEEVLKIIDMVEIKDIIAIAGKIFKTKPTISLVGPNLSDLNYETVIKAA